MTAAALWARLSAEGLAEGDMPKESRAASPWFVRIMLGIAGWIGALFLFAFVGASFAFIIDDAAFSALAGTACCAGAFALFRRLDGNDFAEQFGLVVGLVGQVLLIAGLAQILKPENPPFYFAVAAVQAALALALPNFLHRVLATAGSALAFALGVNQLSLHGLAGPLLSLGLLLVWLEPKRWAAGGRIWRPLGYGLVLALLLIETFRLFGAAWLFGLPTQPHEWLVHYGPLLGRALTAGALIWTAVVLTRREQAGSRTSTLAAGAAILFGLLSLAAPGLASASLILLLGFTAGNRLMSALGILALLGFIAHFYYSLHATLLEKSGILAITGLLLLGAHFLLHRLSPSPPGREADHA
jgi:uncharacterized membrane protein